MLKNVSPPLELLAPARDLEQGRAAILCGADALYVGGPRFGARAGAAVTEKEIAGLCAFAHGYGARVYVAMNTLLYDNELREAERLAARLWEGGADALIVQDIAFLRLELPPIELHASTQVFNMDPSRVAFWGEAGFSRVILERALGLEEIRRIAAAAPGVELEAFVHGAICVGYSGRCYLSRTMSARSGNRGDCSQLCRLPYTLLDENDRPLLRDKHLLSVRDMNLTDSLEAMIDAGVSSFKIEGRLKDMAYVRNVVGAYRRALDEIIFRRDDLRRASQGVSKLEFTPDPAKSFSRGATPYYMHGLAPGVASFDTPKSLGEPLGRVARLGRDFIELETAPTPLAAGDGICFLDEAGVLQGTNLNRAEGLRLYPNRMEGLRPGLALYRNYDHRFVTTLNRARLRREIPVQGRLILEAESLTLTLHCGEASASVSRKGLFEPAHQPEQAGQNLRTQLSRTGETVYCLENLEIQSDPMRFVPASLLGDLRREAFSKLDEARGKAYIRRSRRQENKEIPFPETTLSGAENVTNALAERFYREHGVGEITPGYDLDASQEGRTVLRSRYCLRRELGWCLQEGATYRGKLTLCHGTHRYELQFDCARCEMSILYKK